MGRPYLFIRPTPLWTRLCLRVEGETLLRAHLPPPHPSWWRVAPMLAETLALWLGQPLCVVLSADASDDSSGLSLCDAFGFGTRTLHYEVEVVPLRRPRRGPKRRGRLPGEAAAQSAAAADAKQLDLGGVK